MKNRYYITIVIALLALVSCQKEELYTGPCNVRFKAYVQNEISVTRGYSQIDNSTAPFTAELFVCNENGDVASTTLNWDGTSTTTNLKLEAGTYSFYGYGYMMPKRDRATFDSNTMSIPGIAGMGTEDVMLIKEASLDTNGKNKATVTLQLDHMMAKVTPYFYIHEQYADLRTIKIKKVEFSMSDAATYTATVDYSTDLPTTTWQKGATQAVTLTVFGDDRAAALDDDDDDESSLLVLDESVIEMTAARPVDHFYLCPNQSTANLKMSVTYDVYDEKGEMTRKDVTADNAILKLNTLQAGTNYKLYIKVVPTYLYVLSDNDEVSVLVIQ